MIKKNTEDINYIYEIASKRIKLFSRGFIANIESAKTHQTFSLGVLYYLSMKLDIPIELFVKEDISKELKEIGIDIDV